MIQCRGRHLPVYKVQLVGENSKIRILQRNLLFPLTMRNDSDEKQQNLEEGEPRLTNSEEENNASSDEDVNNYEGPITRSKTKRTENASLLKANILMSNHFNDE